MPWLSLVWPSAAATLSVDASGSGTYSSIQDAIDAASDGDTLEIAAGTYAECVDSGGLSLTLQGDGSASTFLEGSACSPVLAVTSGEILTVSGLTLDNPGARCLQIEGSTLSGDDLVFSGCGGATLEGGAVQATDSALTFTDSSFESSLAEDGAHVWISGGSLSLSSSTLSGGYSDRGGAVFVEDGSATALSFDGLDVEDNGAYDEGGALWLGSGNSLTSTATDWTDNFSFYGQGGAIHAGVSSSLALDGDHLQANAIYYAVSGYEGAGLYLESYASLELTSCSFSEHVAYEGGAIFAEDEVTLTDSGSSFSWSCLHDLDLHSLL